MKLAMRESTLFLFLAGLTGGYIGSCTGLSVGWLVGAFIGSMLFSFWGSNKSFIQKNEKGASQIFRELGQWMLGIQLGQKITFAILDTIEDNSYIIGSVFLFSISLALISSWFLKRYGNVNLITSLFATTPGGTTAMASIADEAGANTMIVSIIQLMRMLCVIAVIPIMLQFFPSANFPIPTHQVSSFSQSSLWFTLLMFGLAWIGGKYGRKVYLPAPWLFGSMLTVATVVSMSTFLHFHFVIWYPLWFSILAQVLIGISIGSKIKKGMFYGIKKPALIGSILSFCFVLLMSLCSFLLSKVTGIPIATALLAFAPGGVAEMASTSLAVHADVMFVVSAQIMRLVVSLLLLPPLLRLFGRQSALK
ncbi:AbrB family transcriptional regulator [Shimazuella sp. AN120528]|uniref:AbrB family transcriptional regulator n=1 Tax=Shimazuella soli TaxID=1892854 RepID=UPI001F1177CA|nr:AbrB family transcriptional regulator [Shimazuella soli]MCH5583941.1 AbrB family transcriptional regulator [Shimazuella soli]